MIQTRVWSNENPMFYSCVTAPKEHRTDTAGAPVCHKHRSKLNPTYSQQTQLARSCESVKKW